MSIFKTPIAKLKANERHISHCGKKSVRKSKTVKKKSTTKHTTKKR